MKKLKFLGLILVIFLVSGCSKSNLEKISYKEYKNLIENNETFVLEVMRTDCSHCQTLKPKLEEITKEYDIKIKYINLNTLTEKELDDFIEIINTDSTPTIIFYEDGEEKSMATRLIGSAPKNKIITKFKDMGYIK